MLLDTDSRLHGRYGALAPAAYPVRPDDYVGFRGVLTDATPIAEYLRDRVGVDAAVGTVEFGSRSVGRSAVARSPSRPSTARGTV